MNKARLNYWVDVATGLAFVLSAASGIVFLLPSSLADGQLRMLGVSYQAWNQLHTWSSLVMVAGALIHVALHWQWVVSMTKKTLRPAAVPPPRSRNPLAARSPGGDSYNSAGSDWLPGSHSWASGHSLMLSRHLLLPMTLPAHSRRSARQARPRRQPTIQEHLQPPNRRVSR